jgi:ribosomal protein S18 acetylase RimI-like enzyme
MKRQDVRRGSSREMNFVVRRCKTADLPGVARLAARLVREHHAMDRNRFFIFDRIEEGYAAYLRGELEKKRSVVLVAAREKRIIGYAFGRIEPRDWNALRDRCGVLHDVYVDERARRKGVAARLADEMVAQLASLGAPRVILMTSTQNTPAQRLFKRLGFRITMLEMTKECA